MEEVDGVQVLLHGLGPLNWLVKKALRSFLRRHLKGYLEKEGKDMIEQELKNIPILYEEQPSYLGLLGWSSKQWNLCCRHPTSRRRLISVAHVTRGHCRHYANSVPNEPRDSCWVIDASHNDDNEAKKMIDNKKRQIYVG